LDHVKSLGIQLSGILAAFHRYQRTGQHELAFIYQDLKPDNIMWTSMNSCVLIDFGSFAARTKEQMVPRNLFVSTPPYQPPEFAGQLPPEEAIQPTADVYSLGVTLLHVLRGQMPLTPDTGEAWLALDGLDLPEAWRRWLAPMLAQEPDARWQTMEQVQREAYKLPSPHKHKG